MKLSVIFRYIQAESVIILGISSRLLLLYYANSLSTYHPNRRCYALGATIQYNTNIIYLPFSNTLVLLNGR